MSTKRKYPVGVQSCESIRKDGFPYIYKTPLIYKIITSKTIYSPLLGRGAGGEATLLLTFGADVTAEESTSKGCSDLTLRMPKGIYVKEIKYDHTAQDVLDQINQKGYAEKYRLERQRVGDGTSGIGRPVTKVGIAFSSEERNITEWKAEPLV